MITTFEAFNNKDMLNYFVKNNETVINITSPDEIDLTKSNYFIFDKYLFVFGASEKHNKPTCMIVKDAPRSKFGYKIIENYRFGNEERMLKHVKEFIQNNIDYTKRKEEEKIKRKKDNENAVNLLNIGDILYDSWGYEQTNIDFYQVVDIKGKSAYIRPIASEIVPGSEGNMSANVRPIKDKFTSDEVQRKVIQAYGNNVFLKSKFGSISKYDGGDDGVYSSWYY